MILRLFAGVLVLANIVTAIGIVDATHEHRQSFVQLSQLQRVRDELNVDFGRLQLEQATWAESNRIDQIARAKLGMKFPESADIVVMRVDAAPSTTAVQP